MGDDSRGHGGRTGSLQSQLRLAAETKAHLGVSDTLECLAALTVEANSHAEGARLYGAAHGIRQQIGAVRYRVWDATCDGSLAALRDGMDYNDFDAEWDKGAALSIAEAIAYAQRGRGERKRPAVGWASLTPAELGVVRRVAEGLGTKDIAARLFVSTRTVQTHLSHIYTNPGVSSRLQLAQEASRHQ